MIKIAGSVMAVAMCVALVACTAEEGRAAPTSQEVVAPQESSDAAVATELPSPTPSLIPPTLDQPWPITGAGVGPVVLGMTLDEAVAALGQTRVEGSCKSLFFTDGLDSLIVSAAWDDPNEIVTSLTIQRATFDLDGGRWPLATAEGIGVGSSADEVISAYPDATVSDFDNLFEGPQQLVTITDGSVPIVMVIDARTNVVVEILVNLTEPPIEYCA